MVWLFVIHFGHSCGPCAWILVAEIWPLSNRPYGIALGASSNWMNNFIVGQVTPDMLSGISYGTYIIFGLLTYMGAAFIWFFVPETKRLTLEEMDIVFGSVGTAQADLERIEEINKEIGVDRALRGVGNGGVSPVHEKLPEGELEKASNPNIRIFLVRTNYSKPDTKNIRRAWDTAAGAPLRDFSAPGYFFARELYEKLHVPIGVIANAVP